MLRKLEGHSTLGICKVLEVTPSDQCVLLHRARLRLAIDMNRRSQQEGSR
ncbi:hypothetical protein [Novipirellula sp.]